MNFDYLFNSDLLITGIKPIVRDCDEISGLISFEDKFYTKDEFIEMASANPDCRSFLLSLAECFDSSETLREVAERGYISEIEFVKL